MTIHHDKLAYGKLEKTSSEMTDEEILKMLESLGGDEEDEKTAKPQDKKDKK